jgi:FMN reductase
MNGTTSPVVIIVGNPKPKSRTLDVARATARAVAGVAGWDAGVPPVEVDLAEVAAELFDWGSDAVQAHVARLRGARLAVVASPVYKATYSGLLKAFLDRIGQGELCHVVVVPLMVGAAANHALALEVHLRPLLVELGAVLPTRGLYVLESELPDVDRAIAGWLGAEAHADRLRRALGVG